jgi:hypothetical protein
MKEEQHKLEGDIKGDFGRLKECCSKAEEVRVKKIDREGFLKIINDSPLPLLKPIVL